MSIHETQRVVIEWKFTLVVPPFDYPCFKSTTFTSVIARLTRPVTVKA
jgi:hypothetical protein